jgi:hypothetical protein
MSRIETNIASIYGFIPIERHLLRAAAGNGTIKGYFVCRARGGSEQGLTGDPFTATLDGTPKSFEDFYGGPLPEGVIGAVTEISVDHQMLPARPLEAIATAKTRMSANTTKIPVLPAGIATWGTVA